MAKRTASDLALTALAVEAERRRKARGLIRYNYGDLVADTTPEERQQIIENYKTGRRHKDPKAEERFVEAIDKEDMRAIREKRGIPDEKPAFTPPEEETRTCGGQEDLIQGRGISPACGTATRKGVLAVCSDSKSPCR